MKVLSDFFVLYKKQLMNIVWTVLGCALFGIVVMSFISAVDSDATSFPIGSLLVCIGGCGMIILYGAMLLQTKFDLLLSFGATRKRVVAEYAVYMLLTVIILWIGGLLCVHAEQFLYTTVFGLPPDGEKVYQIVSKICLGMARIYLIEAGLAVLVAAASLRWGKAVWWIFYFVFLVACQLPNFINIKMQKQNRDGLYLGLIDLLSVTDVVQWLVCTGIVLILSAFAWFILRKQRVTL